MIIKRIIFSQRPQPSYLFTSYTLRWIVRRPESFLGVIQQVLLAPWHGTSTLNNAVWTMQIDAWFWQFKNHQLWGVDSMVSIMILG